MANDDPRFIYGTNEGTNNILIAKEELHEIISISAL
jgi:hypothetical protein